MTELRFGDRRDFEDADRGFIAKLDPGVVTSRDGRVAWDSDAHKFLSGTARTRPTPACGGKDTGQEETLDGVRISFQLTPGTEIAELLQLPPALEGAWHTRGYYGSSATTSRPSTIGGTDAVVAKATDYLDDGDLRFAAQLLKHAVFVDPDHQRAKDLLAQTFERLGQGAENGT